ncbi:YrzE family protein [Nocardia sp. NPDC051832]|uniref:YrzE family protein n=1 Tax=Nocardia sp. NPDC051832 TaxID=3155673 RepID=UPI0034259A2C
MRIAPAIGIAAMTAAAVTIAAAPAYAVPPITGPTSIDCPPLEDWGNPGDPVPPRPAECGQDDWEFLPGIHLRSSAYNRVSTIYGPDGSITFVGSEHFQVRGSDGTVLLGEQGEDLHHVPFGHEVPPPPPKVLSEESPHERAVREGLSRVQVSPLPGWDYTGDLSDSSAFLNTPMGSVTVQAPGTGPDPDHLMPGPGGERRWQPINNFQVLDAQGRYLLGNTLTFGSPMAIWPNAAVPCPPGTVPVSQLTEENVEAARTADELPPPVCEAPATVPLSGNQEIDDSNPEVQRQKDRNDAYSAVATQFGLAVSIGGLIGGAVGLSVGCLIGLFGGAGAGSLSSIPGIAVGTLGGCLAGAALVGVIGTTAGSLLLGIPVGIASGINAYNTLKLQGAVAKQVVEDEVAKVATISGLSEQLAPVFPWLADQPAGTLAPASPLPEI